RRGSGGMIRASASSVSYGARGQSVPDDIDDERFTLDVGRDDVAGVMAHLPESGLDLGLGVEEGLQARDAGGVVEGDERRVQNFGTDLDFDDTQGLCGSPSLDRRPIIGARLE